MTVRDTHLTPAELAGLRLAARHVHEAARLDEPDGIAAVDALVDLVTGLCRQHAREAREETVNGMLAAVDSAFAGLAPPRRRRDRDAEAV